MAGVVARESGPDGLRPAERFLRRLARMGGKWSPRDETGALALVGKGG